VGVQVRHGPLALSGLTRLRVLGMPFLPAVTDLAKLSELRELTVWDWPKSEPSLKVLGDNPSLEFLRLELKRTAAVSSAGFTAPKLRTLWLYDGKVSLVGGFPESEVLRLNGTKAASLGDTRHCAQSRSPGGRRSGTAI
jgi:hypothetical protein